MDNCYCTFQLGNCLGHEGLHSNGPQQGQRLWNRYHGQLPYSVGGFRFERSESSWRVDI